MSKIKCETCGAITELEQAEAEGKCASCGEKLSLPSLSNEQQADLHDGAEQKHFADTYDSACNQMNEATTEAQCKKAAIMFQTIPGFKDADKLAEQCLEKAEICRKDALYSAALSNMASSDIAKCEKAIELFKLISGWKDSAQQINIARKKIEELKLKEEAEQLERKREQEQRRKEAETYAKRNIWISAIVLVCLIILSFVFLDIIVKQKYKNAISLIDSGNYDAAYALLEQIEKEDVIIQNKYDRAVKLIASGDYDTAYILLNGLNYKDSANKLEEILPQYKKSLLSKAEVGSTILFGSYEHDDIVANGREPIEWVVLAKESNNVLVISKYGLDCQPYNKESKDVTWESSSLRRWLNELFLMSAFSHPEREMIQSAVVTADANPDYNTSPGNNTEDKVFCLSMTEAQKYFASNDDRQCCPTAYAVRHNAYRGKENGCCGFWLRTPGCVANSAAIVYSIGAMDSVGVSVYYDRVAIRPAMRIML